ncbi:hypothetical protein cypCar_00035855 [Cyprinus carpio]|nr:hypothetical protein cypCar_00035855 [Cyprinus carpio]
MGLLQRPCSKRNGILSRGVYVPPGSAGAGPGGAGLLPGAGFYPGAGVSQYKAAKAAAGGYGGAAGTQTGALGAGGYGAGGYGAYGAYGGAGRLYPVAGGLKPAKPGAGGKPAKGGPGAGGTGPGSGLPGLVIPQTGVQGLGPGGVGPGGKAAKPGKAPVPGVGVPGPYQGGLVPGQGFNGRGVLPGVATGTGLKPKSAAGGGQGLVPGGGGRGYGPLQQGVFHGYPLKSPKAPGGTFDSFDQTHKSCSAQFYHALKRNIY